jgi:hypothetical protein
MTPTAPHVESQRATRGAPEATRKTGDQRAGEPFQLLRRRAAAVGCGEHHELFVELRINAHAGGAQAAHQAAQRLLNLAPAALLGLHLAERVAVFLLPISGVVHGSSALV